MQEIGEVTVPSELVGLGDLTLTWVEGEESASDT
jgi:hypothetical protein